MFLKPLIQSFPKAIPSLQSVYSILIPSWNNLGYLKLCVRSILENSYYPHQIIIHINEGIDGTLEWVQANGYDYTYSKENAGVCYSLNAMADLVQTNYILYLNDDMYVTKHWDKYLQDAIQARQDNMFYYSGTMIEFENSSNTAAITPYDFGRDLISFREKELLQFAEQFDAKDWNGSCWPPSIVHKDLWKQVGGYTEAYSPGFYSDPDFAMKLWAIGVRDFKGIGKSLVYHFKCKSTGRVVRNNGRKTFAQIWGFPSSFLFKKVLRMGTPYNANQPLNFPKGISLWMAKIKAIYIRLN